MYDKICIAGTFKKTDFKIHIKSEEANAQKRCSTGNIRVQRYMNIICVSVSNQRLRLYSNWRP